MYPSQEINALRKAGKPKEAYDLAVKTRNEGVYNDFVERELAWSLYDCMKAAKGTQKDAVKNPSEYAQWFQAAAQENIAHFGNELFYENLGKMNASVVWNLQAAGNYQGLLAVLRSLAAWGNRWSYFEFEYNTKMFHYMYKAFKPETGAKGQEATSLKAQGMVELIEWYTIAFISHHASFEPGEYKGKATPSEAEQYIKSYVDALLTKNAQGNPCVSEEHLKRGAAAVKDLLESPLTKDRCASWVWVRYKYAQLLLEVEGAENARPYFVQMLMAKPKEAYLWGALAETYRGADEAQYAACLFKGLGVSQNVQMALTLHEKAAVYLAKTGNFAAAKREALIVSEFRASQGWKPSAITSQLEAQPWYGSTEPAADNTALYAQLAEQADACVISNAAGEDFYVEWIDKKNGVLSVWAKNEEGYFANSKVKNPELAEVLSEGAVYHAVFSKHRKQILSMQDKEPSAAFKNCFVRSFAGIFDKVATKSGKTTAFVRLSDGRSYHVTKRMLEENSYPQHALVSGRAVVRHFNNEGVTTSEWIITSLTVEKELPAHLFECCLAGEFERSRKGKYGFLSDFSDPVAAQSVDPALARVLKPSNTCFVPEDVVEAILEDGWNTRVDVQAERKWNKKKNEWTWVATEYLPPDTLEEHTPEEAKEAMERILKEIRAQNAAQDKNTAPF